MRYTVVDPRGGVSFVGPGHLSKMLAAGSSASPTTLSDLLDRVQPLDARTVKEVRNGLLRFDEFFLAEDTGALVAWSGQVGAVDEHPFRVATPELRELSLRPARLGLVIVNLVDRRIVQLDNRYGPIERADRGRVRVDGRPVGRYYDYSLPDDWSIVP